MVMAPVRVGFGLFRSKRPSPVFVNEVMPAMVAPKARMLFGLSTLIAEAGVEKVTTPLRVRLLGEIPMARLPLAVIAFSTVRLPLTAISLVPLAMTRVPRPNGPEVMVPPTLLGVLSVPNRIEPAERVTPVEPIAPKVLAAESRRPQFHSLGFGWSRLNP